MDTIWPADSVEFCPHPDASDILVCGTYKLDEPQPPANETVDQSKSDGETVESMPLPLAQHRRGKCLVCRVTPDDQAEPRIEIIQEIALPAVPDMKWCHRQSSSNPFLGIADSEGHITIYQWEPASVDLFLAFKFLHQLRNIVPQSQLRQTQSISCASPIVLCLSLDWSNRRNPSRSPTGYHAPSYADGLPLSSLGCLISSFSNGDLCLLRPDDTGTLAIAANWRAHEFEPWIAAWDYWDDNIIYSGGDDLNLKLWDIRQGFDHPSLVNKRFEAGVTTVQSHPHLEHIIAVGSYDNTVRIFDNRKLSLPVIQANVGGGVWRAKWHPSPLRKNNLLLACMHNGFQVWDIGVERETDTESKRICHFQEHKSLAYGADWSYAENASRQGTLLATCSFYDHSLHCWYA